MEEKEGINVEEHNKKNTKQKKSVWLALAIVCIIVAIVAIVVIVKKNVTENKAESQYSSLASQVNSQSEPVVSEPEEKTEYTLEEKIKLIEEKYNIEVPRKNIDFADLQANVNQDIYAWIYIPGTNVDYPVLQHPTDDSFYLMHNLDGSYGYPSCVYSEMINAKDFNDRMTVLYAHDLSGGRMFGDLKYFEQKEYFDANRYIYIYLPDDIRVYEIVSSFKHSDAHLMYAYDWSNDDEFLDFLDKAAHVTSEGNSLDSYTFDVDDKALVLSTCIRPEPQRRRLLLGVLLNEAY